MKTEGVLALIALGVGGFLLYRYMGGSFASSAGPAYSGAGGGTPGGGGMPMIPYSPSNGAYGTPTGQGGRQPFGNQGTQGGAPRSFPTPFAPTGTVGPSRGTSTPTAGTSTPAGMGIGTALQVGAPLPGTATGTPIAA